MYIFIGQPRIDGSRRRLRRRLLNKSAAQPDSAAWWQELHQRLHQRCARNRLAMLCDAVAPDCGEIGSAVGKIRPIRRAIGQYGDRNAPTG